MILLLFNCVSVFLFEISIIFSFVQKMDECGNLAEFNTSHLDLSLMNFSFKVSHNFKVYSNT